MTPDKFEEELPQELVEAISKTFSEDGSLPSKELFEKHISDPFKMDPALIGADGVYNNTRIGSFLSSFRIRDMYLKKAFVVYNYEFMKAVKAFCEMNNIRSVSEVLCGTGWLSHWMRKYKVPVKHSVDNKTWKSFQPESYLPLVKEQDAVEHVKKCRKVDMFVMSWPYMDPTAANIWKAMKPGTLLLYIGEWHGGCTADNEFFELTEGHDVSNETKGFKEIQDSFVQFWGIHDEPILFKK
jgi:hypothetical protein